MIEVWRRCNSVGDTGARVDLRIAPQPFATLGLAERRSGQPEHPPCSYCESAWWCVRSCTYVPSARLQSVPHHQTTRAPVLLAMTFDILLAFLMRFECYIDGRAYIILQVRAKLMRHPASVGAQVPPQIHHSRRLALSAMDTSLSLRPDSLFAVPPSTEGQKFCNLSVFSLAGPTVTRIWNLSFKCHQNWILAGV